MSPCVHKTFWPSTNIVMMFLSSPKNRNFWNFAEASSPGNTSNGPPAIVGSTTRQSSFFPGRKFPNTDPMPRTSAPPMHTRVRVVACVSIHNSSDYRDRIIVAVTMVKSKRGSKSNRQWRGGTPQHR